MFLKVIMSISKVLGLFILIILLFIAAASIFIGPKYEIGDCITPIDSSWTWYGMKGKVVDIVSSTSIGKKVYYLEIPESYSSRFGNFDIQQVDEHTVAIFSCSF